MSRNRSADKLRRAITASIRAMTRFWDSEDGDAEPLAEAMTELRRNGQRHLRSALATERRMVAERVWQQAKEHAEGGAPLVIPMGRLRSILDDLATADVDEEEGKK